MRRVRDNLYGIRVEFIVGNGLGGIVEDGGNVVFRLDMGGDGWRVGYENGAILDISLKDLRASGRGETRRSRQRTGGRGGKWVVARALRRVRRAGRGPRQLGGVICEQRGLFVGRRVRRGRRLLLSAEAKQGSLLALGGRLVAIGLSRNIRVGGGDIGSSSTGCRGATAAVICDVELC